MEQLKPVGEQVVALMGLQRHRPRDGPPLRPEGRQGGGLGQKRACASS